MKICLPIIILIAASLSGCRGCSKSGQKAIFNEHKDKSPPSGRREEANRSDNKTTVKMNKRNGVYEIQIEINDIPMHFIFDTGAGLISISETEATFLYKQGKLTQDDIIGSANFIDANGDITEGTIIVLKTVRLGDRVLKNVQASVVHNLKAPLLMGQSALEKFGKISIDYIKGEITFE